MPVDMKTLEEKVMKGEDLTKEETQAVMEAPVREEEETPDLDPGEKSGIKKPAEAAEEEEESEAEPEETPSEKDAEPAKAENKDAEKKQEDVIREDRRKEIENATEKPLDEVDMSDWSPKERALYIGMKKERRKRQDAEREADVLKFERLKREQREKEDRERAEREKAEKETKDPLEGRDPEDFLTVADVRKLLSGQKPAEKQEDSKESKLDPKVLQENYTLKMENWLLKGQQKHPDLLETLNFADELLGGDRDAEAEVADTIKKGGNAALATYNLIKAHPKWPEIESKLKAKRGEKTEDQKKEEEEKKINAERAKRIDQNKNKTVTTGSGGGAAPTNEYTLQEILEMDPEKYAALSPEKRKKILQRYG